MQRQALLVILGPTASGKTSVAARLCDSIDGEIISADSRQIYRKMDLGTGKDYQDYVVNGRRVPVHLIDIKEPGTQYNVYEYQKDFLDAYDTVLKRGKRPVLCGGSGLYIDAVVKGYKLIRVPTNLALRKQLQNWSMDDLVSLLKSYGPVHNTTDTTHRKRLIRAIEIAEYYYQNPHISFDYPELHPFFTGIYFDRQTRRKRITARLKQRLSEGMVEEVRQLMKDGVTAEQLKYYGLEYKFITLYLTGELSYEKMVDKLNVAIHQFAKRQMTWFRRMERNGVNIHWIDGHLPLEKKVQHIEDLLDQHALR